MGIGHCTADDGLGGRHEAGVRGEMVAGRRQLPLLLWLLRLLRLLLWVLLWLRRRLRLLELWLSKRRRVLFLWGSFLLLMLLLLLRLSVLFLCAWFGRGRLSR